MRFGNRDDVAMEILNQLNRRGVDVSAASSNAVQDILDDMQGQIAALYDAFNQNKKEMADTQAKAADLADQLNSIDETVKAATGGDMVGEEVPGAVPPATDTPSPFEPAPEAAPEPAPESAAAADAGMGEPAPETAPADTTAPAPEAAPAPELAPMDVPSDVRVKSISTENPPPKMGNNQSYFIKPSDKVNAAPGPEILSDQRMKEPAAPHPTFGKHLISVASRGW